MLKQYAEELATLKQKRDEITKRENFVKNEILKAYEASIETELQSKDEPYGTVNVFDGDATLKVTIPKKVSWDQEKLIGIVQEIVQAGHVATDYVDIEYYVPETKYKSWPTNIREAFIVARTIEPGTPTIKIEVKND